MKQKSRNCMLCMYVCMLFAFMLVSACKQTVSEPSASAVPLPPVPPVHTPPFSITVQPQDISVAKNADAQLTITAVHTGGAAISYQWYSHTENKNSGGIPINDAASESYTVPTATEGTFYYYCVVSISSAEEITSRAATVTVLSNNAIVPVDCNGSASGLGWESSSWPLGSVKSGNQIEFAVYSKHAERILLEIYSHPYGHGETAAFFMEKGTDNIWRAKLDISNAGLAAVYYAFRAWGPNWPYDAAWTRGSDVGFSSDVDADGNRFNPNKALFDPYARELSHDKSDPAALNGKDGTIYASGAANRTEDTGKYAPKAVVIDDAPPVSTYKGIAQKDAIIYEAHVRGLTKHDSASSLASILSGFDGFSSVVNIPENERGTYAGAAKMAPYLKALGVNTIELLPVHESDNDGNPDNEATPFSQFWGYMTYGYFAPDRRYSSDKTPGGPTREFKEMVRSFHEAGIEVYLDVVYNHTGEGGLWNSSDPSKAGVDFLRGLDNSEYYCLVPSDKSRYWETTGCGNNLRCDNEPVYRLVMDSLKYWTEQMGVDGFRFDLAPVLGQEFVGDKWWFSPSARLINDISSYAHSQNIEVIAEAWAAVGEDSYQVGNYPAGWGEWNGRYRDAARRYLNHIKIGAANANEIGYPAALYGDHDHFNDQGGACKTVNFITAHDGFTLADLVSYTGRAQNEANSWPFGPSGGGNENNDSTTSGGDHALRRQRIRNAFAFLMFSRGVPMIVYGDEFGRTQNGNNNPYNVDGLATWNNYEMISTDAPNAVSGGYHNNLGTDSHADGKNALFLFAQHVLNLRKNEPALRQTNYNAMQIEYAKADGSAGFNDSSDWACRMHIKGSAVAGGSDYIVCLNMWTANVNFNLPSASAGKKWIRIIDTGSWAEKNDANHAYNNFWREDDPNIYVYPTGTPYGVNAHSIVVFKEVAQ